MRVNNTEPEAVPLHAPPAPRATREGAEAPAAPGIAAPEGSTVAAGVQRKLTEAATPPRVRVPDAASAMEMAGALKSRITQRPDEAMKAQANLIPENAMQLLF